MRRLTMLGGVGGALFLAVQPLTAGAPATRGVAPREATFQQYSDFSSNEMLVRRLFSPLAAQKIEREVSTSGKTLAGQPVDLARERFLIYVPPEPRTHRYALLVFVPPWQDARLPAGWVAALDRQGVIFVTAARTGNDEPTLERREPLALLAATNVMSQYPVDPDRVYVAGFSGGSRIALRLALGYPDLFRGALLNAGSDPIGKGVPIPSKELFLKFQESTRLVYVTGERDTAHAADDMLSMRSMHQRCVFNLESYTEPRIGHEVADGASLSRALSYLLSGTIRNAEQLPGCRARLDAEVTAQLRSVSELSASGRRADAAELLARTDEQFGGLAAPQSIVLSQGLR